MEKEIKQLRTATLSFWLLGEQCVVNVSPAFRDAVVKIAEEYNINITKQNVFGFLMFFDIYGDEDNAQHRKIFEKLRAESMKGYGRGTAGPSKDEIKESTAAVPTDAASAASAVSVPSTPTAPDTYEEIKPKVTFDAVNDLVNDLRDEMEDKFLDEGYIKELIKEELPETSGPDISGGEVKALIESALIDIRKEIPDTETLAVEVNSNVTAKVNELLSKIPKSLSMEQIKKMIADSITNLKKGIKPSITKDSVEEMIDKLKEEIGNAVNEQLSVVQDGCTKQCDVVKEYADDTFKRKLGK